MNDIDNWKSEKIADYCALSGLIQRYQDEITNDVKIQKLQKEQYRIIEEIEKLCNDRMQTIAEMKREQHMIKDELLEHWDSDNKTFKCDIGSATVRTTHTLTIKNRAGMLDTLMHIGKLSEAVQSFNIHYLKELKNVGMIPDQFAELEATHTIAITGVKK